MSTQLIRQAQSLLKQADFAQVTQRILELSQSKIKDIKVKNDKELLIIVTIYEDN